MSNKLQREIDELLAKLDTFPPRRSLWARAREAIARWFRSAGRSLASLRLPHISVGHLLLLGIAVIVIASVLNPGGTSITRAVIIAGIVLFLVAFVLSLRRQSRPPEKRWRGEPMELGGSSGANRLRSWWGRWRSRR